MNNQLSFIYETVDEAKRAIKQNFRYHEHYNEIIAAGAPPYELC